MGFGGHGEGDVGDRGASALIRVRPTVATVHQDALAHNLRTVQQRVGRGTRVLAVVKADAYGHGAVSAARTLISAGAWGLAVSLVEEAVELRQAGVVAPLLVLGGVQRASAELLVGHGLRPVVWSIAHLELLSGAVRAAGAPPLPIHLKIDTGMSRLGLLPQGLSEVIAWLLRDGGQTLVVEGVMTHLACADELLDEATSLAQLASFSECLGQLNAAGVPVALRHVCNSAAIMRFPQAYFDMVRPGLALYGAGSSVDVALPDLAMGMSVHSRIQGIRELPEGVRVSYGGRFRLTRDSRIAIIPVGYADGYSRGMSGSAHMLVRGHRCPVVGTITMDICMLDVTDVPGVAAGDEVTLLGAQGRDRIDLYQLAEWAQTVPYEIICGFSKRMPRHPGE